MGDVWIATNASVNSLASFHAVMGPRAVYSANLYIQLSYRSGCSINLKLRELIIACSTLCRNRLCCLPTWYYTQSSLKFGTALGGRGGGGGGGVEGRQSRSRRYRGRRTNVGSKTYQQ